MIQDRSIKDVLEQCKAIAEKAGVGIHLTAVSATGETASIVHTPGVRIDEAGVQVRTRLPRPDREGDYPTAAAKERAMVATSAMVEQLEAVAAGTLAKLTFAETELRKRKAWRGSLQTMLDVGLKAVEPFHIPHQYSVVSAIIRAWAKYAGGRNQYLPAGKKLDNAIRDEEIRRRLLAGESYGELARDFDRTENRIRQIEKRDRACLSLSKTGD
jgi:Mor family transcriptional regulator